MTVKADWLDGDTFAATDENAHAAQTNTNTTDIAARVVGESSSADSEVALFSGTGGKTIKRATASGIPKLTSGVLGTATAGTDYVAPGGALGTPSSGTLTNATGLPISGLTASTTTPLGVGSVELGHASDTTLARSSAGNVSIEGNVVYRAGGTDVPITDGGTGVSTLPSGLLKGAGTSAITAATAGTDYYAPGSTDVAVADGGTGVSTLTGIVKGNGTSAFTAAVSGTDYAPATSGSSILKGNGSGGFSAASAGTDYYNPGGTDVAVADGGTGASTASAARTNLGLVIGTDVLAPTGSAASLTSFPTLNQNTTGSAATLTTPRTINGVSFNGSANIVIVPRIGSTTSTATPSIDCSLYEQYNITALATNITSVSVSNTFDGCKLLVRITGTATRTISWGSSFQSSGDVALLATTSGTNTHMVGFIYDGVKAKFVCVAVDVTGY